MYTEMIIRTEIEIDLSNELDKLDESKQWDIFQWLWDELSNKIDNKIDWISFCEDNSIKIERI